MSLPERAGSVRGLVVVLAIAVLLCFALPMIMAAGVDAGLHMAAMGCCFVLAIVLGPRSFRRPSGVVARASCVVDTGVRLARGDPEPRPPDPATLCVLLI